MKNRIAEAMNDISDRYIEEAHEPARKKSFVFSWSKLIVALSCICLVVLILPDMFRMGIKSEMPAEAPAYYYNNSYSALNEAATAGGSFDMDYMADNKMEEMADSARMAASDRKLIVNGSMSISTLEFDKVITQLSELADKYGAYFNATSISSRGNSSRYYDASIRIPAENYQAFVSELKGAANVGYYSEEADDITDTYTDIDARVNSLKAEEARIMEFYKDANDLSELMMIEERLTDIRYEIDSLETCLHNYDVRVAYSTLSLSITETKTYIQDNDSFLSRITNTFREGWIDFNYFIEDVVLFFVYNIFTILSLAALGFGGYYIYKKRKNRS